MSFDPALLGIVVSFTILANRLIAGIVTPLFDKYSWDKDWLLYIAWVIAGVLVWFADVNLFEAFIPSPIIGKLLTAIVAGGGGNILHDLSDQQSTVLFMTETKKSKADEQPE